MTNTYETNNYLTPDELDAISGFIRTLNSVPAGEIGFQVFVNVYDSNGESVGFITNSLSGEGHWYYPGVIVKRVDDEDPV